MAACFYCRPHTDEIVFIYSLILFCLFLYMFLERGGSRICAIRPVSPVSISSTSIKYVWNAPFPFWFTGQECNQFGEFADFWKHFPVRHHYAARLLLGGLKVARTRSARHYPVSSLVMIFFFFFPFWFPSTLSLTKESENGIRACQLVYAFGIFIKEKKPVAVSRRKWVPSGFCCCFLTLLGDSPKRETKIKLASSTHTRRGEWGDMHEWTSSKVVLSLRVLFQGTTRTLSLSLSLDYQIVLTFSLSLSGSSSNSDIYRCWIGLFISLRLLALIRLLLLLPHSMVSLVTISQQLWSRWWHSSLQKECVLQLGMYRMTARRDPTDRGERMLVIWYWTQPVVYSRAVADGSGIANGMFSLHFYFFSLPLGCSDRGFGGAICTRNGCSSRWSPSTSTFPSTRWMTSWKGYHLLFLLTSILVVKTEGRRMHIFAFCSAFVARRFRNFVYWNRLCLCFRPESAAPTRRSHAWTPQTPSVPCQRQTRTSHR